jgi:hypothetical protein
MYGVWAERVGGVGTGYCGCWKIIEEILVLSLMSLQLFLVYMEIRSQSSVIGCLQEVGVLNKMSTAENVISQVKDECSYTPVTMRSDSEKC